MLRQQERRSQRQGRRGRMENGVPRGMGGHGNSFWGKRPASLSSRLGELCVCRAYGAVPGSGPVTAGNPAVDQSLQEPGYSRTPRYPATVIASTSWQAVTPLPQ